MTATGMRDSLEINHGTWLLACYNSL